MSGRRVLITGAGGFVGGALATGFADLGWSVIAVDRSFGAGSAGPGVERLVADVGDGMPGGVSAVDLVVHAAWTTTDPEALGITAGEYHETNLRPLSEVLGYCARVAPAALVFLSSSGVFAPDDGADGLTDADEPTGSSPYALAKREGEARVMAAASKGTRAVHVVRLGYLYGPGEAARPSRAGVSLVARWLTAARGGDPLEVRADDPRRDWTFAPDLAAALEKLLEHGAAGGAVHLGSPHVYHDSALAGIVAGCFPGVETVTVPGGGRTKPPMVPSDVPALRRFPWTDAPSGVRALVRWNAA